MFWFCTTLQSCRGYAQALNGALIDNAATVLALQLPLQLVVSSLLLSNLKGECHS